MHFATRNFARSNLVIFSIAIKTDDKTLQFFDLSASRQGNLIHSDPSSAFVATNFQKVGTFCGSSGIVLSFYFCDTPLNANIFIPFTFSWGKCKERLIHPKVKTKFTRLKGHGIKVCDR